MVARWLVCAALAYVAAAAAATNTTSDGQLPFYVAAVSAAYRFHRHAWAEVIAAVRTTNHAPLADKYEDADGLERSVLLVGNEELHFVQARGRFDEHAETLIASASKLLTAIGVLRMCEDRGVLLDTPVAELVDFWSPDGDLGRVTVRHTLAFTTGFSANDTACLAWGTDRSKNPVSLEDCVRSIYDAAEETFVWSPGETYNYDSVHMAIAGVAMQQLHCKEWDALFDEFVMAQVRNEFPDDIDKLKLSWSVSASNRPMLAGGVKTTSFTYARILQTLWRSKLLTEESFAELMTDQTENVTLRANSPARDLFDQDLHYALGSWVEATDKDGDKQTGAFSSTGAFGFYPVIDRTSTKGGYWVVIGKNVGEEVAGSLVVGLVVGILICCACVAGGFAFHRHRKKKFGQ